MINKSLKGELYTASICLSTYRQHLHAHQVQVTSDELSYSHANKQGNLSSSMMFSYDECTSVSGRQSGRYGGLRVSGRLSPHVPTTSAGREDMKTTDLPPGRPLTRVCGGSGHAGGLRSAEGTEGTGGTEGTEGTKGTEGTHMDVDHSGKATTETESNGRKAESRKRKADVKQHQETSDQRPQIYPWMTKLHTNHGR